MPLKFVCVDAMSVSFEPVVSLKLGRVQSQNRPRPVIQEVNKPRAERPKTRARRRLRVGVVVGVGKI